MLGKSSAFYKPLLRWRIGLIIGFAALFIFSLVRTNLISQAIDFDVVAAHRLESSYRAQLELDGLFSTVKEAETGQKGFLLTTDPSYLDSYENLRNRHDLILDEILSRFAELQIISNNLPLLHELIHEKFAEMDRTISLVRNGQVDLAMLGEANGSGRMIMDRIRKVSDGLIEQLKHQRQSLARQSAAASESTQTINSVSGLITLPLLFLLFALSWTSVHAFFRNKEHKSEA
ncbi:MAG TPA: CHASE3 domain-containing protein, partial [Fimbriimonadaceae bacterium]|nr:CHASE3 domain-containing protein [Fimbriimonadaceae bacterium]